MKEAFSRLRMGAGESEEYYENPILTVEGEERLIAWHNTVLRDEAGNVTGTLNAGEDITDRTRAEEGVQNSE